MNKIPEYLFAMPEGYCDYRDPKSSVRFGNTYRIDVARKQAKRPCCSIERVADLANQVLEMLNIRIVKNPLVHIASSQINAAGMVDLDYERIADRNDLDDKRDLVNIRFDHTNHPVLCAVSTDINYCPPPKQSTLYAAKENGSWAYTTAAIILHALHREWNREQLLLFPLAHLSETSFTRHDVEKAIGNHLLASGECPLLDKYSHVY